MFVLWRSTPIGKPGEITPVSPVNIIETIVSPDKQILEKDEGENVTFTLQN